MEITLYRVSDDKRVINKNLFDGLTINTVKLLEGADLMSLKLRLENFDTISAYNYLYVPSFKRYYYIDNMAVTLGGLIELQCSVDVLKTYANQIISLQGVIIRGSKNNNVLLTDDYQLAQCNSAIVNKKLSGGELLEDISSSNFSFVFSAFGGGV